MDASGQALFSQIYYSVGGGFIASEKQLRAPSTDDLISRPRRGIRFFASGEELLRLCTESGLTICDIILQNEDQWRLRQETNDRLDGIWRAMRSCIDRGLRTEGSFRAVSLFSGARLIFIKSCSKRRWRMNVNSYSIGLMSTLWRSMKKMPPAGGLSRRPQTAPRALSPLF